MNVMEDLKAYVDGELSPERHSEIEAAMEQDAQLRKELDEIRVLSRLIGDCVVQPEPVGLERTLALLEKRSRPSLFARLFKEPVRFAWVWAAAAFFLLAVFLPMLNRHTEMDEAVAMSTPATADKSAASEAPATTGAEPKPSYGINSDGANAATHARSEGETATPAESNGVVGGGAKFEDYRASGGFGSGKLDTTLKAPSTSPVRKGAGEGVYLRGQGRKVTGDVQNHGNLTQVPVRPEAETQYAQPLLIRTADLSVEVSSVRSAQVEATNSVKSFGGYVEQSSSFMNAGDIPGAALTLRVPEKRFDDALNRIRRLGKVLAESVTGQDVTAQVADTEARVREMKAAQTSYIEMLSKAKHVDDALSIRDRLDNVRQELGSLQAQAKALRNQAAFSTITLSLSEPAKAQPVAHQPGWFDKAWDSATARAAGVGQWLAELGMNVVLLAPLWLPIVIGLWWLGRRQNLRR